MIFLKINSFFDIKNIKKKTINNKIYLAFFCINFFFKKAKKIKHK